MRITSIFTLMMLAGCGTRMVSSPNPIATPNGTMTLTPSVNQSQTDATHYLCVAFDVRDNSGRLLHHVQSKSSDTQKWAIGWFDNATIVLYSSDIGTHAWKISEDGSITEQPTPLSTELIDYGDRLKKSKYTR